VPIDLESPAGGNQDSARLYRARGGEVEPHRPLFTGDVYVGTGRARRWLTNR